LDVKVKVVTDSTCDLPQEVAADLDITVIPAQVQFGSEVYQDGVDLTTDEFYRRLRANSALPKTSPAPVATFRDAYQRLSRQADSIVSIHVAANLSVTHDAAKMASADLDFPVVVVDSQTASMACGLLTIIAARAAREGASLTEIEALVREAIPRTITFGVFGTLEYLARGGRIGKAQAFVGNALKIHPILAIRAGEVLPVERIRTRPKAVERMCQIVEGLGLPSEMSVMRTTDPQEAENLARRLSSIFPPERMYRASIGPAMGTQVGPDAVGVALISERPF
jgi:DegV family protein with EDD domain